VNKLRDIIMVAGTEHTKQNEHNSIKNVIPVVIKPPRALALMPESQRRIYVHVSNTMTKPVINNDSMSGITLELYDNPIDN